MISEAFVWIWLPGSDEGVVAGRLSVRGDQIDFNYGQSYLRRENAVPIYSPELPLRPGLQAPAGTLSVAGCINDAGPDSWGQRVIDYRLSSSGGPTAGELGPLAYLLESGSDRIGALDFQSSSIDYDERGQTATLDELVDAAELLEQGKPLPLDLERAILGGSSVGGARPKALIRDGPRSLIAKFSSLTDTYPVERAEYVAMKLAASAGLDVANVALTESAGRTVLLVDRFDRPEDGGRRMLVSGLTMMGLTAHESIYAGSYVAIAQALRERGRKPREDLHELFGRITFNILSGNTDDHARNTAAFWDGEALRLTPAYDISPVPRAGQTTNQALEIGPRYRSSQLTGCVAAAGNYLLDEDGAREIIDRQVRVIRERWDAVSADAGMLEGDKARFWGSAFLNPYAFYGYDDANAT